MRSLTGTRRVARLTDRCQRRWHEISAARYTLTADGDKLSGLLPLKRRRQILYQELAVGLGHVASNYSVVGNPQSLEDCLVELTTENGGSTEVVRLGVSQQFDGVLEADLKVGLRDLLAVDDLESGSRLC